MPECGVISPMFAVFFHFHGDLPALLRPALRGSQPVRRELGEKTSVKDAIESCGVPHTEVDLIVLTGEGEPRALDFSAALESPASIDIHPAPADVLPGMPRLQSRACHRFVADVHLGALARHLRLLGIDVAWDRDAADPRLLEIMESENRALLTRDRRLLMHSVVRHGYCPRSDDPEEQTREVLRRFDLRGRFSPLGRCLRCNGMLGEETKENVRDELAGEPRTLLYHDRFFRCTDCRRIYWHGSHIADLTNRLARIT